VKRRPFAGACGVDHSLFFSQRRKGHGEHKGKGEINMNKKRINYTEAPKNISGAITEGEIVAISYLPLKNWINMYRGIGKSNNK